MASGDFLDMFGYVTESIRISSELENTPQFREASSVLAYMSMPGEVMTRGLVEKWHHEGKRVVLPVVRGETLELKEYNPLKLVRGYKDILEPDGDSPAVDPKELGLAVVPGVAFSYQAGPDGVERYYRMGRGGGFYDRLLPMLSCPVIGICFPFRFVDALPIDEWDRPVDMVIR